MKDFFCSAFAVVAAYLMIMLPVSYASMISSYTEEDTKNDLVGYLTLTLPAFFLNTLLVAQKVISEFVDKVLMPGVNAQSCGDTVCSGEQQGSASSGGCCYDCGCPYNQYCDWYSNKAAGECREITGSLGIDVQLYSFTPSSFSGCTSTHAATMRFAVVRPPSSMGGDGRTLGAVAAKFNNGQYTGTMGSCTIKNQITGLIEYECPVTIPAVQCGSGGVTLTQNKLEVSISFNDGSPFYSQTLTRVAGLQDITIGSFVCGNGIAESSIGETSTNCCYDVACFTNYYCDISDFNRTNDKSAGRCRQKLSDSDILIESAGPLYFDFHQAGDKVSFTIDVQKSPGGLDIGNLGCSNINITCSKAGSSCQANCIALSCNSLSAAESSCTLEFSINGYEASSSYTLIPRISIPLSYNDGTGTISQQFAKTIGTMTFKDTACGDGSVGLGESQSNCCWDTGCPQGQICDIPNSQIDAGNFEYACRQDNVGFIFNGAEPNVLTTTTKPGTPYTDVEGTVTYPIVTERLETTVKARLTNVPDSFREVQTSCSFGNDAIPCNLKGPCNSTRSGNSRDISCAIEIPEIEYEPLQEFNPTARTIDFQSSFTARLIYNDGRLSAEKEFSSPFNLRLNVQPGCGNNLCEAQLGESPGSCCKDCGCSSGYICSRSVNQCFDTTSISLAVGEIPTQTCTISVLNGDCAFDNNVLALSLELVNAPADTQLLNATYVYEGERGNLNCQRIEATNRYNCELRKKIVIAEYQQADPVEWKEIEISAGIMYGGIRDTIRAQPTQFLVEKKELEEIKTCQERQDKFDDLKAKLEGKKHTFGWIRAIMGITAVGFLVACFFGVGWACYVSAAAGAVACVLPSIEADLVDPQIQGVEEIKNSYNDMCGRYGVRVSTEDLARDLDLLYESYDRQMGLTTEQSIANVVGTAGCIAGSIATFKIALTPAAPAGSTTTGTTTATTTPITFHGPG